MMNVYLAGIPQLSTTHYIIGFPNTGINGFGSLYPAVANRLPFPAIGMTIFTFLVKLGSAHKTYSAVKSDGLDTT